jgi:hypothetical protein
VVLLIGLLACAPYRSPTALGWSLGGEAHVFVAGDRFARDYYRRLTGSAHLADSLTRRPLVSVPATRSRKRNALVLSASGTTPASIGLARFHARGRCGYDGIVTEIVVTFPTGAGSRGIPPAHKPVVALLDNDGDVRGGAGSVQPALNRRDALELLNRVVRRAESKAPLLRPLTLDADQAADAGEVVPLGSAYGVGFRARVLTPAGDTVLVTGIAATDRDLRKFRWVARPRHVRLTGGMIPRTSNEVRYSLRGIVAGNGILILVDEIADVSARNSRLTAVSVESRAVIAAQPLALRCP